MRSTGCDYRYDDEQVNWCRMSQTKWTIRKTRKSQLVIAYSASSRRTEPRATGLLSWLMVENLCLMMVRQLMNEWSVVLENQRKSWWGWLVHPWFSGFAKFPPPSISGLNENQSFFTRIKHNTLSIHCQPFSPFYRGFRGLAICHVWEHEPKKHDHHHFAIISSHHSPVALSVKLKHQCHFCGADHA